MIRTRFAPSPTGELHIGAVRTALFEYLFAKSKGGEFLLRIEDTDRERYVEGATERIAESLKWLGIVPDNLDNIMIQSKRLKVYKKHAFDLVREGKAYICTCSKERLAEDRARQEKEGRPPKYEGHCRDKIQDTCLPAGTARDKTQTNSNIQIPNGAVIRMKMPESGKIVVDDLIRGKVEFDAALLDDQIILKSDGYPTYHLASVVDDHEMEITHVIRAEEWLSSTPKHIILYEMFGWAPPEFAHLSMILGPDKKKLSKRHGATSIADYKAEGYLPEALLNFIALMGWNPKDEREIFSLSELEKEFKLENVNRAPAVFNVEKLNDIDEKYIRNLKTEELNNLITNYGAPGISVGELSLVKRGGYVTLRDAAEYILKLRKEPVYGAELLIFKKSDKGNTATALQVTSQKLKVESDWGAERLQEILEKVVAENSLTNGDVFWPARVALSGEEKSPSPIELAVALGKEETLKRIGKAVELINSLSSS